MWTFVAFVCAIGGGPCIQTGPMEPFQTEQQCEDFAENELVKLKGYEVDYRCLSWGGRT